MSGTLSAKGDEVVGLTQCSETRAIKFVALSPQILNMSSFRERCNLDGKFIFFSDYEIGFNNYHFAGLSHATGITRYAEYLEEKAATYREAQLDFVRERCVFPCCVQTSSYCDYAVWTKQTSSLPRPTRRL